MAAELPPPEPLDGGPLTPRALQALRRLVGVLLQEERGPSSPSGGLADDLRALCASVPPQEWVAMVQRQRVVGFLQGHPLVARLLPFLPPALQKQARDERLAALHLARLTIDTLGTFERVGLPVLVIKGLPLSLQTTGQISGRGRSGDLDLWVAPHTLTEAIRHLEQQGFQREWGEGPLHQDGWRWRYCRWTGYEVTLRRQWQTIDLHWALS
ncbi:MAG: nucleotidyltransferase family protein, partial [Cyanobacteriota bacterium]|nr:nucleotidyltransferase family protein [Cyanobacteriota bacterium]